LPYLIVTETDMHGAIAAFFNGVSFPLAAVSLATNEFTRNSSGSNWNVL
jgi:hypothetical protein